MIKLLSIILVISLPKTTVRGAKIENLCSTFEKYTEENMEMMGSETIKNYYNNGEELTSNERKITFADGKILKVKKFEVLEDFNSYRKEYREINNWNKIHNLNKDCFLKFYGCTYETYSYNDLDIHRIFIITDFIETNLLKNAADFRNSLKKSERLTHYKSLFSNIAYLHSNKLALLSLEPSKILSKTSITSENNFTLLYSNFQYMKQFGKISNKGSKHYITPSYFASKNPKSSFQRDIFALLLIVAGLEYGIRAIVVSDDCYFLNAYSKKCFGDLLDHVYLGYYKGEVDPAVNTAADLPAAVKADRFGKIHSFLACESLECLVLSNLKFSDNDFKTAEVISGNFDKVIEYQIDIESKRRMIVV